jgi:cytochrome P450
MDVAVEEFIRWVTPIVNMCRVANDDYEIGGEVIRKGQQVVLMYPSANRDETHFPDPDRLDIRRTPNRHLAFGGGIHTCAGNSLARMEAKVAVGKLVARFRSIEPAGAPVRGGRARFRGFMHYPVALRSR